MKLPIIDDIVEYKSSGNRILSKILAARCTIGRSIQYLVYGNSEKLWINRSCILNVNGKEYKFEE